MTTPGRPGSSSAADSGRSGGTVLFATYGNFSHINRSLLQALRQLYPRLTFEEFDALDLMRGERLLLARCAIGMLGEYGLDSLKSRKLFRYRLTRSAAFFDHLRRLYLDRLRGRSFVASIQTQSMFDGATGTAPHVVYTDHVALARKTDVWDEGVGAPSPRWIERERSVYLSARHVFTFGPAIRSLLVERYGIDGGRVSFAGAGPNVQAPLDVSGARERYARRNILFVGVDWERKGGPDLVAAFRRVREALPDATLTIVGCKPQVDCAGVTILGRIPPDEVAAHFAAASVFCMPTRLEPFGVVYVEALHYRLPVVATVVADISDFVRDGQNGFLVQPGAPQALAEALIAVLKDPDACQAFGARSGAMAQDFTWSAVAARLGSALPELAAEDMRA